MGIWEQSQQTRARQDLQQLCLHQLVGRREEPAHHRADRFHQDLLRQTRAAERPHPLLRVRRGSQAAGDAALPDRRRRAHPATHRHGHQSRQLGTLAAGGYIWHTTGSGKTLTSFKAAQLARGLPEIDKVLFVVDRKDLDYQTMREYERFEKGAANSNTSTAVLQKQLEDPNARIIITTIQKLSRFVAKNKKHPVYDAHVVVIFDECHRSQFGDMHAEITRASSATTCSASPARRSLPTTRARAATRCAPPNRPSATSCTPTPSSMPSTTRTCCRSASTTSTPSRPRLNRRATSRCRPSTPSGRCSRRSASRRSWLHPRALRPEDQARPLLPPWRQAAQWLQLAVRHGVHRRRQTLLRGVRQSAKGHPACAAAEGRPDLQLRRQRGGIRRPAGRGGV
jgi:hypothetical protein